MQEDADVGAILIEPLGCRGDLRLSQPDGEIPVENAEPAKSMLR